MMEQLTPEGCKFLNEMQQRFGLTDDAVLVLMRAVIAGDGRRAEFDHPDLGGRGHWRAGGTAEMAEGGHLGLKAQIAALCSEIAERLDQPGPLVEPTSPWLKERLETMGASTSALHEPDEPVSELIPSRRV